MIGRRIRRSCQGRGWAPALALAFIAGACGGPRPADDPGAMKSGAPDSLLIIVRFDEDEDIDLLDRSEIDTDSILGPFDDLTNRLRGRWQLTYPRTVRRIRADPPSDPETGGAMEVRLDYFSSVFVPAPRSQQDSLRYVQLYNNLGGVDEAYLTRRILGAERGEECPISLHYPRGGTEQGHLAEGRCKGIGASYAWSVPGGDGSAGDDADPVRVLVVDDYAPVCHEDLPVFTRITCQSGGWDLHGTHTLGIMAALDDGEGVVGIAPGADYYFGTRLDFLVDEYGFTLAEGSGLRCTLDIAMGDTDSSVGCEPLAEFEPFGNQPGDIIVLPLQSDSVKTAEWPIEVESDIRALLRVMAGYGVTVVEAAGNEGDDMDAELDWDSYAILVGAGDPDSGVRHGDSNYGTRIDCHAWGDGVFTTSITTTGLNGATAFGCDKDICEAGDPGEFSGETSFDDTSAASSIVGGIAASLQGATIAAHGEPLTPSQLREFLRDDFYGQVQDGYDRNGDWIGDGSAEHIGPQPDLRRLLRGLSILPEAYIRDSLDDCYQWPTPSACEDRECRSRPLYGAVDYRSPDIIPQAAEVSDPEETFLDTSSLCSADPGGTLDPDKAGDARNVTHVYTRLENRGKTADTGVVQIFWTPATAYMPFLSTHFVGRQPFELDGGNRTVVEFELDTDVVPDIEWVSWMAILNTSGDPLGMLDAVELARDPRAYDDEYYAFRYRNVGVITTEADKASLAECQIRGHSYAADEFSLHIDTDLPDGTLVGVALMDLELLWSVDSGEDAVSETLAHWMDSSSLEDPVLSPTLGFEAIELDAAAIETVSVSITLDDEAAAGDYELVFEQHAGAIEGDGSRLGRYTFVVRHETTADGMAR